MSIGDRPGLRANRSSASPSGRAGCAQQILTLTATDMQFKHVPLWHVDWVASSIGTASRNAKRNYLADQSLVTIVFSETHRDGPQFSGPAVDSGGPSEQCVAQWEQSSQDGPNSSVWSRCSDLLLVACCLLLVNPRISMNVMFISDSAGQIVNDLGAAW
jgi:hypothetical protein